MPKPGTTLVDVAGEVVQRHYASGVSVVARIGQAGGTMCCAISSSSAAPGRTRRRIGGPGLEIAAAIACTPRRRRTISPGETGSRPRRRDRQTELARQRAVRWRCRRQSIAAAFFRARTSDSA
jgi:hypothetical protein